MEQTESKGVYNGVDGARVFTRIPGSEVKPRNCWEYHNFSRLFNNVKRPRKVPELRTRNFCVPTWNKKSVLGQKPEIFPSSGLEPGNFSGFQVKPRNFFRGRIKSGNISEFRVKPGNFSEFRVKPEIFPDFGSEPGTFSEFQVGTQKFFRIPNNFGIVSSFVSELRIPRCFYRLFQVPDWTLFSEKWKPCTIMQLIYVMNTIYLNIYSLQ